LAHLHVHVFPRTVGDRLYARHGDAAWVGAEARRLYADTFATALHLPRSF
jgi:diadenosine tetraphosphate (Ap4A) HIT family hydrolase